MWVWTRAHLGRLLHLRSLVRRFPPLLSPSVARRSSRRQPRRPVSLAALQLQPSAVALVANHRQQVLPLHLAAHQGKHQQHLLVHMARPLASPSAAHLCSHQRQRACTWAFRVSVTLRTIIPSNSSHLDSAFLHRRQRHRLQLPLVQAAVLAMVPHSACLLQLLRSHSPPRHRRQRAHQSLFCHHQRLAHKFQMPTFRKSLT